MSWWRSVILLWLIYDYVLSVLLLEKHREVSGLRAATPVCILSIKKEFTFNRAVALRHGAHVEHHVKTPRWPRERSLLKNDGLQLGITIVDVWHYGEKGNPSGAMNDLWLFFVRYFCGLGRTSVLLSLLRNEPPDPKMFIRDTNLFAAQHSLLYVPVQLPIVGFFLRRYFSGRIQIFLELLIIAMSSVFRIQHVCLFCKMSIFDIFILTIKSVPFNWISCTIHLSSFSLYVREKRKNDVIK